MAARESVTLVPEHSFDERWRLAHRRYKGTIRTFARNFVNSVPGADVEDIEQELLMMLWKCVERYDPDKGASFNTLFQGCARNRCISLVRTAHTKGRSGITCSLDDEAVAAAVDEAFNTEDSADVCIARQELRHQIARHGAEALLRSLETGRRIKGAERVLVDVA